MNEHRQGLTAPQAVPVMALLGDPSPTLAVARVSAAGGTTSRYYAIDLPDLPRADRAVSCLVEPQAGDTVLVSRHGGKAFILAVLSREGLGDLTLSPADPLANISMSAQSLSFDASAGITMRTPELAITARIGRLVSDSFSLLAKLFTQMGERHKSVVTDHAVVADTVTVSAGTRVVQVHGVDMETAQVRTHKAQISTLEATTAIIKAKEDLRLDGERVTMT